MPKRATKLNLSAVPAVGIDVNEREVVPDFGNNEVDALLADEARRGARLVAAFPMVTLGVIWFVLGDATRGLGVRVAFCVTIALVLARWAVLWAISTPHTRAAAWANRNRVLLLSAWGASAGFAWIHFTAGPYLGSVQLLTLSIISTAVCALGVLSAASSLLTYAGCVSIMLLPLAIVIQEHGDRSLVPVVPGMLVFFVVALTMIARKNNSSVREKTLLSMKVRDFGFRDALTGLRNRAFVELFTDQRARQLVGQWQNEGRRKPAPAKSLALLLVDLDHFKKVNDKHGHAAGDQVLTAFAKIAQSSVRSGDIVARWGGEEFLVVMEVDDRASAHAVAERLRETVAKTPVTDSSGRTIDVTCSIGACLFPFDPARADELTWQETMELADGSLYRAKSKGRNRTVWAKPDPDFSPRQLLEHERDDDVTTAVFRKAA
jgi:diguanylate cyclase (GGDEF)-like protein